MRDVRRCIWKGQGMIADALHRIIYEHFPDIRGKRRMLIKISPYCDFAQSEYGPYLRVRPKDTTNRHSLFGWYGFELHDMIRALPRDAMYLDIGSNTGLYAMVAGQHLTDGEAIAFEPNSRVFADLVSNIEKNELTNVTAFNFGLGSETGLVEFTYDRNHSGAASLSGSSLSGAVKSTALLMAASEIGLAERLKGRHVFAKIDVEGAELQVLTSLAEAGALAEIKTLYVEIDPKKMAPFGDEPDAIYDFMAQQGFAAKTDRRGTKHYDEIFEAT